MSFFQLESLPPERPTPPKRPPWSGAPENELGVAAPTRIVLVQTDQLAIAVTDVVADSTGFAARLAIRVKPGSPGLDPRALMMGIRMGPGGPGADDEALRFGVEFSDGRRATNLERRPRPDAETPAIVLSSAGGSGGGGHSFESRYWVYPLPPPGTLTFAIEWPARGIETTRVETDAGPIVEAGSRSEQLWEDDRPVGGGGAAPTPGSGQSFEHLPPEKPSGDL
jgi:hypothetical protein